jgi:hypothetical protein
MTMPDSMLSWQPAGDGSWVAPGVALPDESGDDSGDGDWSGNAELAATVHAGFGALSRMAAAAVADLEAPGISSLSAS